MNLYRAGKHKPRLPRLRQQHDQATVSAHPAKLAGPITAPAAAGISRILPPGDAAVWLTRRANRP